MSGYVMKAAMSELAFEVDWRQGYLHGGECVVDDLGWRITPVEAPGADLAVASQQVDQARSRAVLRGGIPGRVYMLSARVRTNRGRELERAVVMRIAEPAT